MMHVTTIQEEPADVYAGKLTPRTRWVCSCGKIGRWQIRRVSASLGGGKHVSKLERGQGRGRRIEEHW